MAVAKNGILLKEDQHYFGLSCKIRQGLVQIGRDGSSAELTDFYNENAHDYSEVRILQL